MNDRPAVLIEDWLPFEAIGVESLRERGASSALPPLNFLHIWWARRPLSVSRAAILAALLPDFEVLSRDSELARLFKTRQQYEKWFLRLIGITGDPVKGRKEVLKATELGVKLGKLAYGGAPRSFTVKPSTETLKRLQTVLTKVWGTDKVSILDPFSGGGSIPFEALRYDISTIANELNPVAAVILLATLDFPYRFGESLENDLRKWGKKWSKTVKENLSRYYFDNPKDYKPTYLWARTVSCPTTGKIVPLSPNWWISKNPEVAVRLLVREEWNVPRFEIVRGSAIDFDPNEGTISGGVGRSPWTRDTIDGDYVKREAQAGRMGEIIYAIANKNPGTPDFRSPTDQDLASVAQAIEDTKRYQATWEAEEFIPTESIGVSNYDRGHRLYGIYHWRDFFSPRQLLGLATYVKELRNLRKELYTKLEEPWARAIETLLALALDKAVVYNNRACRFDPSRGIRSIFDKHNYAFVWSYGEFDCASDLLPWCISQVADAYHDLVKLVDKDDTSSAWSAKSTYDLTITQGLASQLISIPDKSVHAVITDPPYFENVMYAELADFFYVWLKRTLGHLYPDWFSTDLTNQEDEAVANYARFKELGRKKKNMAERDYERKMAATFREAHRVLQDNGVMTVMFTHKKVEAWDTLATALIKAGFTVETSWPVHTESEHSLHQAKTNSAQSTILLTCRKRPAETDSVWWDDIQGEVRRTARETAKQFVEQGVTGVDLYISTFGPVLSVISRNWPVLTSEVDERTGKPKALRPETALELAREEVVRLRKLGLLHGREIQFDLITDWYLMAWDAFRAEQFPADEARKLAIALGLNVEDDLVGRRVLRKKGKNVQLMQPKERRSKSLVNPDANTFTTWLDAVHTALLVYKEDGGPACDAFLKRTGFRTDTTFKAVVEAMINAVPRTRIKGKYVRPEADSLEKLRAAFFEDIEVPVDPEEQQIEQLVLDLK